MVRAYCCNKYFSCSEFFFVKTWFFQPSLNHWAEDFGLHCSFKSNEIKPCWSWILTSWYWFFSFSKFQHLHQDKLLWINFAWIFLTSKTFPSRIFLDLLMRVLHYHKVLLQFPCGMSRENDGGSCSFSWRIWSLLNLYSLGQIQKTRLLRINNADAIQLPQTEFSSPFL